MERSGKEAPFKFPPAELKVKRERKPGIRFVKHDCAQPRVEQTGSALEREDAEECHLDGECLLNVATQLIPQILNPADPAQNL